MKIYNRYILTVALLLLLTTVVMIAAGQGSLSVFYTVYIIETLMVTELYVYFNRQARRGLNIVSLVFFGIFLLTVVFQVIRIIS